MEHGIASLEHGGETETPRESQEGCEDTDTLADLKKAAFLLLAGLISNGRSQDLSDDHNCDGHIHHHNDQGWDHKGQQCLGVLPVEPTGVLSRVDFLGLCGTHRDAGDHEGAAVAQRERNHLLTGLAGVMQDENQAVKKHEAQRQHPEKDAEVEEVDEEGGSHASRLVKWEVMVVDSGRHNEPDVGHQEGGGDIYDTDVTHVGSSILGH